MTVTEAKKTEASVKDEAKNDEFVVLVDEAAEPKEQRIKIVVDEEDNQLNYVAVGVNGKVYQIMRGVEVEVPLSVVKVLENAKATRLVKEIGGDGKATYVPRSYNTVPFRVLR